MNHRARPHIAPRLQLIVILLVALLSVTVRAMGQGAEEQTVATTRAKYLLLDNRIIDTASNAKLTVGVVEKYRGNPLFGEDKPWEIRFDNLYPNVLYDKTDGLYKCWYNLFIADRSAKGMTLEQRHTTHYHPPHRENGVCYATSRDGLKWEKPELGLVEFEGSKTNNLVLRGSHGAGVFKDPHDPDQKRRYKMLHARDVLRCSDDGLHWGDAIPCPGIESNGDTHNHMLWAPDLQRYVGFVRLRDKGQRIVGRTDSADLKHWAKAVEVLRNNARDQAYAMPVFRYADIYLGLVAIFRTGEDRVHTELAWSPDTVAWQRIDPGTPLIGNSTNEGDYDWGCVYAADDPVVLDDEIRIYYGGSNGRHTSWRDGFLCLATLRPDGWAGYEPIDVKRPAKLLTRPVVCSGSTLRVTADATGGEIIVRVHDGDASKDLRDTNVIAESRPISGNVTAAKVEWKAGFDFSAWIGKPVRIELEGSHAKIYSFAFDD